MCKAFEETRQQGALQHAIDTANRMIADGFLSLEKIAEYAGLALEKVQELAKAKNPGIKSCTLKGASHGGL